MSKIPERVELAFVTTWLTLAVVVALGLYVPQWAAALTMAHVAWLYFVRWTTARRERRFKEMYNAMCPQWEATQHGKV